MTNTPKLSTDEALIQKARNEKKVGMVSGDTRDALLREVDHLRQQKEELVDLLKCLYDFGVDKSFKKRIEQTLKSAGEKGILQ